MTVNNNDDDDKGLFRAFVKDVKPLETENIEHQLDKPAPRINKNKQTLSSFKSSDSHDKSNESDSYFAYHLSKKNRKKLKSGQYSFDATLDLHGQTIAQSERLLKQFLLDCQQHHIESAIIVHGQGHHSSHGSILKPAVLYWLSQQEAILAYCPAQQCDGGKGATYFLI